ncbi:MAG: hypothetical protein IKH89_07140 [Bacteroidales bacterium]|nr:hypothetical protein [Bacteroidales bacterium]
MKRIFLFMSLMVVTVVATAQKADVKMQAQVQAQMQTQTVGQSIAEQQYFKYIIVSITGNIKSEGIKVDVDDGQNVDRLRDKDGKKMTFKTPAAVLMYFISEGWEMYVSGSSTSGSSASGFGSVTTAPYWIMRKPCTKEEFDAAVKRGIK